MKINKESLIKRYEGLKFYIFFGVLGGIWFSLILFTLAINTYLNIFLSNSPLVVNNVTIDKLAVIVAPIVEECVKLAGYGIIFLVDFNKIFRLGFNSKKEFIDCNLAIVFFAWVGIFGLQEGIEHNAGSPFLCLWAFLILNALVHITYSIYPFISGRKYGNLFVFFLPVAILLHSVHNFIIVTLWDNKWVTFAMVIIFLLPLVYVMRNDIFNFFKVKLFTFFSLGIDTMGWFIFVLVIFLKTVFVK